AQRSRLVELRQTVTAPGGARELLQDRVAKAVLVAEWAEAWVQEQVEREGAAKTFEKGMMARYFTAAAEAWRAIADYLKLPAADDSATLDLSQYRQKNTDAD